MLYQRALICPQHSRWQLYNVLSVSLAFVAVCGDAWWQSRDARPGKALPSILIADKWVIWSLLRFIGFDEKPWSTVIYLPIHPLLWSISFDGKPWIAMDIPLIQSLLWSIGFDGKPWSTVDIFAYPAITVVHRFYNWVSLQFLISLCSLHAPPPILWELILRKEVSQVSSSSISWRLVSGLCGSFHNRVLRSRSGRKLRAMAMICIILGVA